VLSEGRITFDSVYRFKGQEAAAVVLVDTDAMAGAHPEPHRIDRARRVLYVGMTRATVRLDIVVAPSYPMAAPDP
jgi:superfamily I DNA and RNA helicase